MENCTQVVKGGTFLGLHLRGILQTGLVKGEAEACAHLRGALELG